MARIQIERVLQRRTDGGHMQSGFNGRHYAEV